jgi:hypothetical protein
MRGLKMSRFVGFLITLLYIVGGTVIGGLILHAYINHEIGLSIVDVFWLIIMEPLAWVGIAIMAISAMAHQMEITSSKVEVAKLKKELADQSAKHANEISKLAQYIESQERVVNWIRGAIDEAIAREKSKRNAVDRPKDYSDDDDVPTT